jgi:hypothetical protein
MAGTYSNSTGAGRAACTLSSVRDDVEEGVSGPAGLSGERLVLFTSESPARAGEQASVHEYVSKRWARARMTLRGRQQH